MENNIKKLRKEKGLIAQQLADRLGCSVSFLFKLENGQRSLSTEWILKLTEALDVGPEELSDDKDYIFNKLYLSKTNPKKLIMRKDVFDHTIITIPDEHKKALLKGVYKENPFHMTVPVLNWSSIENYLNKNLDVDILCFVFGDNEVSKSKFGLNVNDSSMEPRFFKGDIIIVDPSDTDVENNDYCLVDIGTDEPLYVFRQYQTDDWLILLKPLNSSFPITAYYRDNEKPWTIIGKIIDMKPKLLQDI